MNIDKNKEINQNLKQEIKENHYDLIAIGFGKGGKTVAGKLASKGKKVALIEKDEMMYGGSCPNVACLPTKRLIKDASNAPKDSYESKNSFYKNSIERKNEFTSKNRKGNYDNLVKKGVEVIDGEAEFTSPNSILVKKKNGEKLELTADKFVISTGSHSFMPDIKGLKESDKVYDSKALIEVNELPKNLTIIGGGYIGIEYASMYANFGSKVTVLVDTEKFLPKEDRDAADAILKLLEKEGVTVLTNAKTNEIKGSDVIVSVNDEVRTISSDAILVAAGRRPNVSSLNVEKAKVELTERGAIKVDEHNRTTNENIWATGDVIGELQFTYVALDDARIVLDDINGSGERNRNNRGEFAYTVFLSTPYSKVGLSEEEAKKKGKNYVVSLLPMTQSLKAKVLENTDGYMKAIIDKDTQKILGVTLFAPRSEELINMMKFVMDNNFSYQAMRDFMFTHPVMAEALNDLFDVEVDD